MKSLDLRAVLGVSPSCEVLVGLQGFTLGLEEPGNGVARVVVGESDVVLAAAERLGWGNPEVGVYFSAEGTCLRSLAFFLDGFACCLSILTGLTIKWAGRHR